MHYQQISNMASGVTIIVQLKCNIATRTHSQFTHSWKKFLIKGCGGCFIQYMNLASDCHSAPSKKLPHPLIFNHSSCVQVAMLHLSGATVYHWLQCTYNSLCATGLFNHLHVVVLHNTSQAFTYSYATVLPSCRLTLCPWLNLFQWCQ